MQQLIQQQQTIQSPTQIKIQVPMMNIQPFIMQASPQIMPTITPMIRPQPVVIQPSIRPVTVNLENVPKQQTSSETSSSQEPTSQQQKEALEKQKMKRVIGIMDDMYLLKI